jgi:hydrogenase nickel incorporation protein HypB
MSGIRLIEVKEGVFAENGRIAETLRQTLTEKNIFLLNVMGSPGSGKTSLILSVAESLSGKAVIGVVEADIESTTDAEKVAGRGLRTVQLRTRGLCHLDASMVTEGIDAIGTHGLDLIIIENIGNLVCPAEFDTGAMTSVVVLSIPEGDDKPLKYPLMFTVCDMLVIHKIDYLPFSDFDIPLFKERVRRLNPAIEIFEVSSKTGEGVSAFSGRLMERMRQYADNKRKL